MIWGAGRQKSLKLKIFDYKMSRGDREVVKKSSIKQKTQFFCYRQIYIIIAVY